MTSGKTDQSGDKRLVAVKRVLRQAAEHIDADFGILLWDGDVIAMGPNARTDLLVVFNSPAVVSRLLRRPRLATLIDLAASGDVDIVGGTLLDLAARRGSGGRGIWKKISKFSLARALWPFLFSAKSDAAATPLKSEAYQGEQIDKDAGGRDNKALVQFHYDLSNAFYQLFLDPEMQYSCAYFPTWESALEDAQRAKLDMICRKLRLKPGERFLDIGCGWGGLVCHAARHYGVEAHGVTLSEAQLAFTKEKIARLGLEGRVHVELRDYREVTGTFDKIASIGMFEHVGLDNHAAYFSKLRDLLKPRGILLNHAITRPAKKSARAFRRKRPEYQAIVNYIFPGSELDHIGGSVASLERHGFEVHDVEAWREHYALTTRRWCERLYAEREVAIREVGEAKTRLWLLYLAGVSLGFERGTIGIFQTVATRRARGLSGLPPTRADLYADVDITEQR